MSEERTQAVETIQKYERHRSAKEEIAVRRSRSSSPAGSVRRQRVEEDETTSHSPKERAVAAIQSHERSRAAKREVEEQRSRSNSPKARTRSNDPASSSKDEKVTPEDMEGSEGKLKNETDDDQLTDQEKRQKAIQLLQNRSRMTLAQQEVTQDQEDAESEDEEHESENQEERREEHGQLLGNERFSITVGLMKASGLRDTDDSFFAAGKSDPYVKVLSSQDNGESSRLLFTSSIVEDKCNPTWDPTVEQFSVLDQPATAGSFLLQVEVMEDDVGNDDHLGYGRLVLTDCQSHLGGPKEIRDKLMKIPIFTTQSVEEEYYHEDAHDRLIHEVPEFCGWVEFRATISFQGESHDEFITARREESALVLQNLFRGKAAVDEVSQRRVIDQEKSDDREGSAIKDGKPSETSRNEVAGDNHDQGTEPLGENEEEEEESEKSDQPRFHVRHRVELSLLKATDLPDADSGLFNGTSDPYVKVFHDGALIHKSATIEDKLNPVWDPKKETFIVIDTISITGGEQDEENQGGSRVVYLPLASRVVTLFVEVWEADIAGTEEFLGCGTLAIDVDVPTEAVVQAGAPNVTRTKKEDEHELELQAKDFTAGSLRRKKSSVASPLKNRGSRSASIAVNEGCGRIFFSSKISTVTQLLETAAEAQARMKTVVSDQQDKASPTKKKKTSVKTSPEEEVATETAEDPYANVSDPRDKPLPSYLTSGDDDHFSPGSSSTVAKKKAASTGGVPTALLPPLEARYLKTGPKLDAQRDQSKRRKEAAEVKFRLQRMFRDLDRVDMSFQYLESQGESERKLKPISTKERKRWANKVDSLRSEMRKGGTGFTGIGSNAEKKASRRKQQSVSPQRRRNPPTTQASTPDPMPTKLPPLGRTQ